MWLETRCLGLSASKGSSGSPSRSFVSFFLIYSIIPSWIVLLGCGRLGLIRVDRSGRLDFYNSFAFGSPPNLELDFTRLAQAADFTAIDKAVVRSFIAHVEFTTPRYQDDAWQCISRTEQGLFFGTIERKWFTAMRITRILGLWVSLWRFEFKDGPSRWTDISRRPTKDFFIMNCENNDVDFDFDFNSDLCKDWRAIEFQQQLQASQSPPSWSRIKRKRHRELIPVRIIVFGVELYSRAARPYTTRAKQQSTFLNKTTSESNASKYRDPLLNSIVSQKELELKETKHMI
jgi:hypothetical protein